MSENTSGNAMEVRHLRSMVIYGLIFAVVFFTLGLGIGAVMKMNALGELTSSTLFNTIGQSNVGKILETSGMNDFSMASTIVWILTIIGFTVGAVLGWQKEK